MARIIFQTQLSAINFTGRGIFSEDGIVWRGLTGAGGYFMLDAFLTKSFLIGGRGKFLKAEPIYFQFRFQFLL